MKSMILLVAFSLVLLLTNSANPLQNKNLEVQLMLSEKHQQPFGLMLTFDGAPSGSETVFPSGKDTSLARTFDGTLVRINKVRNPTAAYQITIDSNANGDLKDDETKTVEPNSSVTVRVTRKWPDGRVRDLPYSIKCLCDNDQQGAVIDMFLWLPHYRAEGTLRLGGADTLLVVLDVNGDGSFDELDSARGSNLGIDRDRDGQIHGAGEWLFGWQIIEYAGANLLVEKLSSDGQQMVLARTTLRHPKVGEPLPTFTLTTTEGKGIQLGELKGKVHLLDFWATWCQPCLEKFPQVKQLEEEFKGRFSVIAINVDGAARVPAAHQAIKEYKLNWPHVVSGQGTNDPVWKVFSLMGPSVPLYVLVDTRGQFAYIGSGGENLSELRAKVKELVRQ